MKRLEFHIAYDCFNNCIFCSERSQLKRLGKKNVRERKIKQILLSSNQSGFNHVTFTGGEPTLHPNFIEMLQFSKKLGYATYVTTNGGLFSKKMFAKNALKHLDEICFSIHGHNPKLHNSHTGNKKSFRILNQALKNFNMSRCSATGFANVVLTKKNIRFVCDIINLISRFKKIKQMLISNIAPEGQALLDFKNIALPLKQIKEQVSPIAKLARQKSITVRFFGMPLCILSGYEDFSNDLHWSPRVTFELWKVKNRVFLKKTTSYKPTRNRIKTSRCNKCSKRNVCGGIFTKYYKEFGDSELLTI
ncbi:radical SAM protein [Thermoproteota archaeon]